MVAYETWVSIVRLAAERDGANLHDFETNSEIVSVAAELWNEFPVDDMNQQEASELADSEVTVT